MIRKGASYSPNDSVTGANVGGKSGQLFRVVLLDGTDTVLDVNKKTAGQWVFDHVIKKLDIIERDYFGLLYEDDQECQQWLDLMKPVKKQTKKGPQQLFFCVKFYPVNPISTLESTRVQLYWQVKRDFIDGRLPCNSDITVLLSGLMAQAELGDCKVHSMDYLPSLCLLKPEYQKLEANIVNQHQKLSGMTTLEAMSEFLRTASSLDVYGMVFFDVKYEEKMAYVLGLSPRGISLTKNMTVVQTYGWERLTQISYRGRKLSVKLTGEWVASNKVSMLNFDVDSAKICRELYHTLIDHIKFYKGSENFTHTPDATTNPRQPLKISSSIDILSNGKGNEEHEGVARAKSLPRSVLDLHPASTHVPYPTNTSIEDPILKALKSRARSKTVSSQVTSGAGELSDEQKGESSDAQLSTETSQSMSYDNQSIDSNDSLLDLANDLGEEAVGTPRSKRSGSEGLINAVDIPQVNLLPSTPKMRRNSTDLDLRAELGSTSDSSLENSKSMKQKHKLLQNWVMEQKKRDAEKAALQDSAGSNVSLPRLPSSSSTRPYKLRLEDSPAATMSQQALHRDDLYSIPRSLLAPSPSSKPHPFSRTTSNSTPYPQSITSSEYQSDYDIPRSVLYHGSVNSLLDSAKSLSTTSGSVLQHQGKSTYTSSSSSLHSSEQVSQADHLRDEYPDYDVPKAPKEYLDYDVPKPHPRPVTPKAQSLLKNENSESVRNAALTPGEVSFGDLDCIMAEINLQVLEAQQLSAQHTFLDEKSSLEIQQSLLTKQLEQHVQVEQKARQEEQERLEEEKKRLLLLQQEQERQEQERQMEESRQRLERHKEQLKQQQISFEDIIALAHKERPLHARAFSEDHTLRQGNGPRKSNYDRLPPGMVAKILSDQDVRTLPETELPEPPSHLADLGQQFKFEKQLSHPSSSIDATATMEDSSQLPPDVAKFMRLVRSSSGGAVKSMAVNTAKLETTEGGIPPTATGKYPVATLSKSVEDIDIQNAQLPSLPLGPSSPHIYQEINAMAKKTPPQKVPSLETSGTDSLPVTQSSNSQSCESLAKNTPGPSKRAESCKDIHAIDTAGTCSANSSSSKLNDQGSNGQLTSSVELVNPNEPSPLKREPSLPMSRVNHTNNFDAFAQRSRSFNARRPFLVDLKPKDGNPIPSSEAKGTGKAAAITPSEQSTRLDEASVASRNSRVMTWMNNAKNFWSSETATATIQKPPVPLPALPDMSQTLPLSQSVRSKPGARELSLLSESARVSKSSTEFKDHVYEDPDVVLRSTLDQRKAKATTTRSQSMARPRPRSAKSMIPYITREVSLSRDGKTCYATDV